MLKRKIINKIIVASSALFALFLIYLIPNEEVKELEVPQNLEYINLDVNTNSIFLLDDNNYLGKALVVINSVEVEDKAKELLEVLINGGVGESRIPSGFRAILPSETKILSTQYKDNLIKIDFSKDLLNISKELEEKMVEAIVYTLTTIDEIDKVIIYVEGEILTKLPQTNINLPSTLDRNFGINKESNLTNTKDINQVTIYYINKYNDNTYYVPVTKYLNDDRDKIKIIIDNLSSSYIYEDNLSSYLRNDVTMLDYKTSDNVMEINFNKDIFPSDKLLESLEYTLSYSIFDNYDVDKILLKVNGVDLKEINKCKFTSTCNIE